LFDLLDTLIFLIGVEVCTQNMPYLVEILEIVEAFDEALD